MHGMFESATLVNSEIEVSTYTLCVETCLYSCSIVAVGQQCNTIISYLMEWSKEHHNMNIICIPIQKFSYIIFVCVCMYSTTYVCKY